MLISFEPIHLYVSISVLVIVLMVLWALGRSLSYLFFCVIFGVYLIGVVSVVIFPIHVPDRGMELSRELQLNLKLFNFGRCDFLFLCIRNIYENVLLTIPFGFGINFISKIKAQRIIWLALVVGIMFEVTQLALSLAVRSPFRVVDVNDVILNATGVLFGYGLFGIFARLFKFLLQKFRVSHKHIFAYVYDVVNLAEN